jgi:hypothetical protein
VQQAVNEVADGVGAIATDFGVQDDNNATGVEQAAHQPSARTFSSPNSPARAGPSDHP